MTTDLPSGPERDAWLQAALRHAPDAQAGAPAALSQAILRQAQEAAPQTPPRAASRGGASRRSSRGSTSRGSSSGAWSAVSSFWAWLVQPHVATGFAGLMVATLAGVLWWGQPMDDAVVGHAPEARVGDAASPAAQLTPPPPRADDGSPATAPQASAKASIEAPLAPKPEAAGRVAETAIATASIPTPKPAPAPTPSTPPEPTPTPTPPAAESQAKSEVAALRREANAEDAMAPAPKPAQAPVAVATAPAAMTPPSLAAPADKAAEMAADNDNQAVARSAGGAPDSVARAPQRMADSREREAAVPAEARRDDSTAEAPTSLALQEARKARAAPGAATGPAPATTPAPAAVPAPASVAVPASDPVPPPAAAPPVDNPVARLRAAVAAWPQVWTWQQDGGPELALDADRLAWLQRLDRSAAPHWAASTAATTPGRGPLTSLQLRRNGQLHTTVHLDATGVRLEIAGAAPGVRRASLPPATVNALRQALAQLPP